MHNSTRSSGRANPSALLIDFPRSNRSQNATSNSSGLKFDSDENTDQNLDDSSGGRHHANDIQNNIQIDELDDVILPTSIPAIAGNTTQNTSGSGSSRDYVYSDAEIAIRNQQRGRDNNRPNTHTWRFCIDYRKSDDYTKSSDRPIPSMQQ
jgi:hypothetical protein